MTTLEQAARQALETLERASDAGYSVECDETITALREALEQAAPKAAPAPQQEAQEPVATLHCDDIGYVWAWVTEVGTRMRFEQPINLYTAPQPAPAPLSEREALTCEWTHNDDDGYWDTSCGKAWGFDDGGPKENNMNFCHCCGKTLRIKGKEAGNVE